jgi:Na+-driven multidrug efflux pump
MQPVTDGSEYTRLYRRSDPKEVAQGVTVESLIKPDNLVEAGGTSDADSDVVRLVFCRAVRQETCFSLTFAVSRVVLSLQSLLYTIYITLAKIPNTISASSPMFMVQQGFYGAMRGWLSTTAVITGRLNGEEKFEKIGPAVNQGLLMAVILGVPVAVLLGLFEYILLSTGMDSSVADQAGGFLRAAAYGAIPANLAFVDQVFLLSVKQLRSAVLFSVIQVGLSLLIGIPWSYEVNNLTPLGYGIGIASLFTFVLDRLVFLLRTDAYSKFHLFDKSFNSGTTFLEFIFLSLPTCMQAASEWLPTILLTILIGSLPVGNAALDAINPSMQLLIIFNTILLGLGTAATVSTANYLGKAKKVIATADLSSQISNVDSETKDDKYKVAIANARIVGKANLTVTFLFTLFPAALCFAIPKSIGDVFLGNVTLTNQSMTTNSTVVQYGQEWFSNATIRFIGATFLLDGIRNTATGIILGRKDITDNYLSAFSNLLITTGLSVLLGYFLQDYLGPLSYIASRLLCVALMTIGLTIWWNRSSDVKPTSTRPIVCCSSLKKNHSNDDGPVCRFR